MMKEDMGVYLLNYAFYDEKEIRQTLSVLALGCRNDNCVDAGECVCER